MFVIISTYLGEKRQCKDPIVGDWRFYSLMVLLDPFIVLVVNSKKRPASLVMSHTTWAHAL